MRKLNWTGDTQQHEGQTFIFLVPARRVGGREQFKAIADEDEPVALYINGLPVKYIRQMGGFDERTQSVPVLFQFVPEEDHAGTSI